MDVWTLVLLAGTEAAKEQIRCMKSLAGKSILVIDDDAGMLRAVSRVLKDEGAAVTCADWAGDAMDFLIPRNRPVDLVITDLRMPFVTGITVVYAIHEIFPALPVIVLTAFGTPEARAACKEQGVAAFLEKPLASQTLVAAVKDVLQSDSERGEANLETGPAGKESGI